VYPLDPLSIQPLDVRTCSCHTQPRRTVLSHRHAHCVVVSPRRPLTDQHTKPSLSCLLCSFARAQPTTVAACRLRVRRGQFQILSFSSACAVCVHVCGRCGFGAGEGASQSGEIGPKKLAAGRAGRSERVQRARRRWSTLTVSRPVPLRRIISSGSCSLDHHHHHLLIPLAHMSTAPHEAPSPSLELERIASSGALGERGYLDPSARLSLVASVSPPGAAAAGAHGSSSSGSGPHAETSAASSQTSQRRTGPRQEEKKGPASMSAAASPEDDVSKPPAAAERGNSQPPKRSRGVRERILSE
jgi:hypothetical protein